MSDRKVMQEAPAGDVQVLLYAQEAAHDPGEYAGQQSFMRASEILALAQHAAIAEGSSVLDLCCGIGGPGRLITRERRCDYLGIDRDPEAIRIARAQSGGLSCRFDIGDVPPVPRGTFDVVLLLETLLAFADKGAVLREVAGALRPGGRFALTAEVGAPLTAAEREQMPSSDTVWPVPSATLDALLVQAGLTVRWSTDCTASHRAVAASLLEAYEAEASLTGHAALEGLIAAHRLWVQWLGSGRVRKLALVAEKSGAPAATRTSGRARPEGSPPAP